MKMAKFYKITLLFSALIMSVIIAFSMMTFGVVKAETKSNPLRYFSGVGSESIEFKDGAMVATVKDGEVLAINNRLVIDDFSASITLPESDKFETVKVKFFSSSFLANGNVKNDQLITSVENVLTIRSNGTAYLNGDTSNTVNVNDKITVKADKGYLTFNNALTTAKEYRVDAVGAPVADISFVFDLKDGVDSATFAIKSIDQKASDGKGWHEQLFTVDENGKLNDTAYPRVTLQDSLYNKTVDGESELVFFMNVHKDLSFNVHSVLGDKASDFYIEKVSPARLDTEKSKWIKFESLGEKLFNVTYDLAKDGEYVEQFKVKVIDGESDADVNAPRYIYNEEALKSFKLALKKEYTDDLGNSVYLGKEVEIPSLSDLVFDEEIPYADLKPTLYYKTPSGSGSSSNMHIDVKEAGDYLFFVAFSDGVNKMPEEDFIKVTEDNVEFGQYVDFIFSFHISDDAPISIERGSSTGIGFIGVTYTASPFKIDADGCTTSYTLYYNANKNANAEDNGWKVIPKASAAKDETYTDEFGNTYDYVKSVNYDGKLTFTPTEAGLYKIVCDVTSEYTTRSDSEYKTVNVEFEPTYVKVPSTWLRDNVWSVVFLSVGTLCLIGIIVLLCIKPKEETESD